MTIVVTAEAQIVDPAHLVRIRYVDGATEFEVAAIWCRYVVALNQQGQRAIAIEIATDPTNPRPSAPYYSAIQNLSRRIIAPAAIRSVQPYLPA